MSDIIEITHAILYGFYVERDIEKVLQHFQKNCTWIGPCEAEYFTSFEDIKAYFYGGSESVPSCVLENETYTIVSQSDEQIIVMGKYIVRTQAVEDMIIEAKQRCSFIFQNEEGIWKLHHLHTSNIYEAMQAEDSYFPSRMGAENYKYMQRLLREKNEVINMIDSNVKCGLKGSNDDETYSFFYVNEGLYQMLGYTYEEFMEMSQGCAKGAVYPLDLEKALHDCAVCFSKGMNYVTEYRMKKKDGTLMWVMDSGKKYKDEQGNMKINSILMDITELKTSQINLQIEQERYKIALENITDVMFEYDLLHDRLIKYVRKGYNRKNPVEKIYIEHYFHELEKDNYIHLDDIGTLKAFLLGEIKDSVDIRLYQKEHEWIWIQVHGSFIYEDGKRVKCIGIWRDITDEKIAMESLIDLTQRDALTHLYHQKSVEKKIQYLLDTQQQGVMMIMDIDNFKGVNDTYGHLNGNKVLLAVTDILLRCSKHTDYVCRIGGDEFMIYFPSKLVTYALACAQKIEDEVRNCCVEHQIRVTMSIGIVFAKQKEPFSSVFEKADTALYQAKNNGRNQYAIWKEDM